MTYPIKPVDTVRKPDEMLPADKEGIEGRWLDVPRLQQKNDEVQSNYWCGRASASMVLNYYLKFQGKADQYIGHDEGKPGVGPNGQKHNLRFLGGSKKGDLSGVTKDGLCWPEGALVALGWTADSGELSASPDGIDPTNDAQVEKIFARHIDQLKKNNPIVQYTQLTMNRGHIVVINGYKKDAKGKLWLRIVDPCWVHTGLIGSGNYLTIKEPSTDSSYSEYWMRAARLVDLYPKRTTRMYAHADRPHGRFEYAIPDKSVPDDHELVHLIKVGGGDGPSAEPTAPASTSSTAGPKGGAKGDTKPAGGSTEPAATPAAAPKKDPGAAPQPAACPPVSGNSRLPFEVNRSTAVTGEAIAALYHLSERGLGGFFPLGDTGLFHGGAHFTIEQNKPVMAIADGEVVAARMGGAPGEHPWGDTGFVILRHKVKAGGAEKNVYSMFVHLKKEVLHPDRATSPWLKRLLQDASKDKATKAKWRILAALPTWKDADKASFSPANVQNDKVLKPGVYEEETELLQAGMRFIKVKDQWVRVFGAPGDDAKAKELSSWADFDIEKAAKNNAGVKALKEGKVAVFDADKDENKKRKVTAAAGDPVGTSGWYLDGPTLHWSVFTKDEVFPAGSLPAEEYAAADAVKVEALDLAGKDPGKPEHTKALIEALDKEKKHLGTKEEVAILEPGELRAFFRTPSHCWKSRYLAVKGLCDFKTDVATLVKQDRYKSHTEPERKAFTDNSKAFVFWDDLSAAEEFPTDGKATFIHPATALRLMSTVSVLQDHDDPPAGPTGDPDRLHPGEDVTLIVRDSKGPLAAVTLTVKANGNVVATGPTDSAGEFLVKLEDVTGQAIEVEVDKGSLEGGQLYNVANETGSPSGLMPGAVVGEQTTNGSDFVPSPRLGLRVKTTKELTGYAGWDDELHKPKGAESKIPKDEFLEIERFVFRRDDGKFEAAQVSRAGQIVYFWSIDNGAAGLAAVPREEHGGKTDGPNVIGSWSLRVAHLTDHPVLCGRVLNIGDGEELQITWCVVLAVGAPEHDVVLLQDKCKTAAGGFSIGFDPHSLTQDNQLLNTPKAVYAKVKYKDQEFSLRGQAVTCYGDAAKITDPGPKPGKAVAEGPELTGYAKVKRGEGRSESIDQLTYADKSPAKLVSVHELAPDLAKVFIPDGGDKLYAGACGLQPHLATDQEALSPAAEALAHHRTTAGSVSPDLPAWILASAGRPWQGGNGLALGICARDCKEAVSEAGQKSGCTEAIRQRNLTGCHQATPQGCRTAIQIGKPNKVKEGKCPEALAACGSAHHDKSKCFVTPVVSGPGAEERERWQIALPMQVSGPSFPYFEAGREKQLKVAVINPKSGAIVVCSLESRGGGAKSPGNAAAPQANVTADEFKDKPRLCGVSFETAWKLDLPRTNGDAVVLLALVPAATRLGPVAAGTRLRLKDQAKITELLGL